GRFTPTGRAKGGAGWERASYRCRRSRLRIALGSTSAARTKRARVRSSTLLNSRRLCCIERAERSNIMASTAVVETATSHPLDPLAAGEHERAWQSRAQQTTFGIHTHAV